MKHNDVGKAQHLAQNFVKKKLQNTNTERTEVRVLVVDEKVTELSNNAKIPDIGYVFDVMFIPETNTETCEAIANLRKLDHYIVEFSISRKASNFLDEYSKRTGIGKSAIIEDLLLELQETEKNT